MDLAATGARLATSAVAPLIKKMFVVEKSGAGLIDQPVRLEGLVSFKGEKRTLSDEDFRKLSKQLVERASKSIGLYEQLPAYELNAVTNALVHSLRGIGNLDMDDAQAVQLGHQELALRLRGESQQATHGLSSDAVLLHASILETACLHILHFFTQRSTFVARTLVEQSHRLNELTAKIDELIARTPSPADASFEERYSDYVIRKHSELTIFGLDLDEAPESWPLDTAYLSLTASSTTTNAAPLHIPADEALAANHRVILRGVAGSGKTTLIQWLAVSAAARRTVSGKLLYLHDMIPFVLPLRTLTREGSSLPTPEEFLSAMRCPLSGAQPSGWIDRVLSAGRGLLLVDGIDEVPQDERETARVWLRELVAAFPDNRWLVTSRPSAVRGDWLSTDGFTELDLASMSRDDVESFIRRWHAAAGISDTYARVLLPTIWSKQDLGRLATNPLMCGLICALHRDRRGYLPDGRKELYDAALSMLLSRRDRERGIPDTGIRIGESHQIQLLQKLAYWLIRNGRSEMDAAYAIDLLAAALPAMPQVSEQGTPEEIYRHLLIRSGILREPSVGSADFIHRSFQDYLGAKAAVEELDFDLLTNNAHLDQWEDVIRMAVAHARPKERAHIIDALISRGDTSQGVSQRLHLLAAACMEHAVELLPKIRSEVQDRTAALIPPRSIDQARALAGIGPFVLELLPGPEDLTADESYFTVLSAIAIATDGAIPVLAKYRESNDSRIRLELARAWNRFNTRLFADEIISHLNEHDFYFPASNKNELLALKNLGGRSHLEIVGDIPSDEFKELCDVAKLTHLWLSVRVGTTFEWLAGCHSLQTITLDHSLADMDLSSLDEVRALQTVRLASHLGAVDDKLFPRRVQVIRGLPTETV